MLVRVVITGGGAGGAGIDHRPMRTPASTARIAAAAIGSVRFLADEDAIGAGCGVAESWAVMSSPSAMRASPMSRSRRFGSFVRQRFSRALIDDGTFDGSAFQSGSLVRTCAMRSEADGPEKSDRPISIS